LEFRRVLFRSPALRGPAPAARRAGRDARPALTLPASRSGGPRLGDRDHADRPPAAPGAELNVPRNQREQGVVAAAAHTHAGVEVGAVLAHDDLAGADQLAAEALDAEPLGVG